DLGGHDEIVLMQTLDLLGLQRDRRIAPTEADVRKRSASARVCPVGSGELGAGTDTARAFSASITRAGIWRKILEFVRLSVPLLKVGRGRFFDRNLWPDFRIFGIQRQPFLKPRVGVGFYGVHRTFRYANTAVDAFVRVDHEHVLALVETIHGAHLNAVHGFAANA